MPVFVAESAEMAEPKVHISVILAFSVFSAVNIENTESLRAGRSAKMALNIENIESSSAGKSAKSCQKLPKMRV